MEVKTENGALKLCYAIHIQCGKEKKRKGIFQSESYARHPDVPDPENHKSRQVVFVVLCTSFVLRRGILHHGFVRVLRAQAAELGRW